MTRIFIADAIGLVADGLRYRLADQVPDKEAAKVLRLADDLTVAILSRT